MIRIGKAPSEKDFYIWEPTLLKNGSACIPIRWFIREGKFFADAYRLVLSRDGQGWVCAVNMQHHCLGNSCDCSGNENVFQERERLVGKTHPKVKHRNPGDLVLNMAQMRNAAYTHCYRKIPAPLDREHAITEGCIKVVTAERLRRAAAASATDDAPALDPGGSPSRAQSPLPRTGESRISLRLPRRLHELQAE